MKLAKIRLPDDSMAIYDIQGVRRLKNGDDVITRAALLATKINGQWHGAGRSLDHHQPITIDAELFDSMPVAIDMAPGIVYQYEPTVQEDGVSVALQRKPRPC